ncbi:DUF1643 domain-containing protein [Solitalea lacus]|uniref:DUF1643 domain-containing protein n=1 Tax=Solitalea lacus TaxID=2911172 RepID=UPI001ED9DB64|nr:DUF1643 domain-containing protein [Solitalea lacus]UKJ09301.1 DUF1643 domain-containing protein [Solitalea lacus]
MVYEIKLYNIRPDNLSRFTLGTVGAKPLFVVGLNPSTADDKIPDLTIKKVMTFAEQAGFDSFVMFNLYAQRTPYPDKIHDKIDSTLHRENIDKIVSTLKKHKNPSVLAGWGQTINVKPFFIDCLNDIYNSTKNQNISWLRIGNLTASKHPRHPSRAAYKLGLTAFDIKNYLEVILKMSHYKRARCNIFTSRPTITATMQKQQ